MDETPEYIRMCEEATEIQEAWKPQSGDFVHSNVKEEVRILYFSKHHGSPPEVYLNTLFTHWLPRQDQLQDMMIDRFQEHKYPLWQMMYVFNNFIACPPLRHRKKYVDWLRKYVTQFTTLEQLWLAFIMERMYKKIWNGEDWVVA